MDLPRAVWPLADDTLTYDLLELLHAAKQYGLLKKGTNHVQKCVNRSGAEMVILGADTNPIALVSHLPRLCEEKNIPYVYVPSKLAMGRACGRNGSVIAACIKLDSLADDLSDVIQQIKERVEALAI
ncbi:L30e-like protein [Penicillium brevicompactum]|uniref:50S ribosomal protein L30e-like protein n=1 Tax=Penicillium brevicompactum TaxID=5074 RepID=UPI002540F35B|nr:50S ribosomal protein L30e-like protein [Penicillium brevicompactum]KAJ5343929.1 50S ribosomal protein L30e-like protein [Penicillium brevicompactum]